MGESLGYMMDALAELPSLRTGEAVVSGEAIVLPVRTTIRKPNPFPKAEDPELAPWRELSGAPDLAPALAKCRGLYDEEKEDEEE